MKNKTLYNEGKPVGLIAFTKKGKRKYMKLMKEKNRFKPLLNDAWVDYLKNVEFVKNQGFTLEQFYYDYHYPMHNKRSVYGNYRGPLFSESKFQDISPIEFPGPLKGVDYGMDVGSGPDKTARFQVTLNEPLKVFPNGHPPINPDFEL